MEGEGEEEKGTGKKKEARIKKAALDEKPTGL